MIKITGTTEHCVDCPYAKQYYCPLIKKGIPESGVLKKCKLESYRRNTMDELLNKINKKMKPKKFSKTIYKLIYFLIGFWLGILLFFLT